MFMRLLALVLALAGTGCRPSVQTGTPIRPRAAVAAVPVQIAAAYLPNAWQVHRDVISGGLPEGDAAFAELARLGVRTVISVDGMKPDVETARQHGLRYVHLPHGYDGISAGRSVQLAQALRTLPGPFYIHCHHGKHRSPAAAAVACVGAGLVAPENAEAILQSAGTSRNYRGLYAAARNARPLEIGMLAANPDEFPESSPIPPLTDAMVALEQLHDDLKRIAAAKWQTHKNHPDLIPAHAALLLRERFTELLRLPDVHQRPRAFQKSLHDSEAAALFLEQTLNDSSPDLKQAAQALARISRNCAACHREYRDTPAD